MLHLLSYYCHALKDRVSRASFELRCSGVRTLPPIQVKPGPLTLLSQVSARDLTLYLIALRSFYPYLPGGEVIVVDDGTLGQAGRDIISRAAPGVEFLSVSSIDTQPCPKGATWERLFEVLRRCRDQYVIQLDSDMICLAPPLEVLEAVAANRPFLLGSPEGQRIIPVAEASAFAKRSKSNHIQPTSERLFDTLENASSLSYVRACSAFAGFPKGFDGLQTAIKFSSEMSARLGARWNEWGSEQVTSNFLLANAPSSVVLPFPKYASAEPGLPLDGCSMIHFMGSWRWNRGNYRRFATRLLAHFASANS